jgi:hypothetical protein
MDLYLVSLATGAIGLGAMAFGGLSHGGHAGHAHVHGGHGGHTGMHAAHGGARHLPTSGGFRWTSLLSPRVLFSVLVGFGASGLVAAPLGEPFRLALAIAGGLAFETFLVAPLWRFLFRFESRPAATLESAIEDNAKAVTGFDVNGNGLVAIDVDGQLVQLLATLDPDERSRGVKVRRGDLVRIASIDAERGRCTVTLPTS